MVFCVGWSNLFFCVLLFRRGSNLLVFNANLSMVVCTQASTMTCMLLAYVCTCTVHPPSCIAFVLPGLAPSTRIFSHCTLRQTRQGIIITAHNFFSTPTPSPDPPCTYPPIKRPRPMYPGLKKANLTTLHHPHHLRASLSGLVVGILPSAVTPRTDWSRFAGLGSCGAADRDRACIRDRGLAMRSERRRPRDKTTLYFVRTRSTRLHLTPATLEDEPVRTRMTFAAVPDEQARAGLDHGERMTLRARSHVVRRRMH